MLRLLLIGFFVISPVLVLAQVKKTGQTNGLVIVCNVPSESALDEDNSDFNLTMADLKLCTHLICNDKSYKNAQLPWEWTKISYLKQMQKDYKQFTNSRKRYPDLKITLGVDPTHYLLSTTNSSIDHIKFVQNAFRFVSDHHFDGMNLLWRKNLSERKQVEFVCLLRQLKKIFKPNKLLLTTSYDGKIDNINKDTFRNATDKVDFMHISVYDYDSLDHQYNNYQSHVSNIFYHLTLVNTEQMRKKSLSIPMNDVNLKKIVFEQRFFGFDISIPLHRCTMLNYNHLEY
ncbi:probable chitinase 2 [Contarinia nasturtii]|uniref:probable chitinase 2 n=1 Tax=Contarinia nasturtii TaxID=265458 RepID=UPI0012D473B3|nr:probable chitinase 2 [Contarinia nasturtii]